MAEFKIEKEHALKIIKAMRTNWDEDSKTPNAHALDMAVEALEKQIPKKMNPNFNCIYCDCGNPIYYQTDRLLHHYNYCCECGQALKWEDNA